MKRNVSIVDFVTDPQLLGLSISQPQETGCIRGKLRFTTEGNSYLSDRERPDFSLRLRIDASLQCCVKFKAIIVSSSRSRFSEFLTEQLIADGSTKILSIHIASE